MISDNRQYVRLTTAIEARVQGSKDSFILFLKTYSAIVAGSAWLSIQHEVQGYQRFGLSLLSDALVILTAVVTGFSIKEHMRSWWDYRTALTQLAGKDAEGKDRIPGPKESATKDERLMIVTIIIATLAFLAANPFRLLS